MSLTRKYKQRHCAQCECLFNPCDTMRKLCPGCSIAAEKALRILPDTDTITVKLPPRSKISKCKVCKGPYTKRSMTHKVCGPDCAAIHAGQVKRAEEAKAARVERQQIRARKAALETPRTLAPIAQRAINKYVRTRDADKPCICCGLPLGDQRFGGAFDAGHYRSVGSAVHLRFDLRNIHAQRKQCNNHDAGNHVSYRAGLIVRIGLEAVEALEADQRPRKFTVEYLRRLIKIFNKKTRRLERRRNGL